MKNTLKSLISLGIVALLFACATFKPSDKFDKIEKASWLLGKWANANPKRTLLEVWQKENDSTYTSQGYMIRNQDTTQTESISLEQRANQLFYVPTVKGQNNNAPVRFTLTQQTESQVVFENPKHDFPQKITYTLIHKDSLFAEVSGKIQGAERSQKFPMKRIKN
ncbi:MAG: DUF6265 family protein [Thermoflexibacter sp.]|nr:DUF6265 family protein [Thermoflexibacter sp.]